GIAAVHQVFAHERVEPAAAFALRHVDELMEEPFPVLPAIGANDDAVPDRHRPGGVRDDLSAAGGVSQFLVAGQRNPVYHQDTNPARVPDAGAPGIGDLI